MTKEFNLNDTIIRKGSLREKYSIKEKKFVNNILHYIIQSNNSSDIILSKYAIEKDFVSSQENSKRLEKKSFIRLFQNKIKNILPTKKK